MKTTDHGNHVDLLGNMRQATSAQSKGTDCRTKGIRNAIITDTLRGFIDRTAQWESDSITLVRAGV